MKINKSNGLKIAMDEGDDVPSFTQQIFMGELLLSSLGIMSILGILFYSLNLSMNLFFMLPYTAMMAGLILYGEKRSKSWFSYLPLFFACLLLLIGFNQVLDGFFTWVNGIRTSLSYTYLRVILPFDTKGDPLIFFQMMVVSLISIPLTKAIRRENPFLFITVGLGFIIFSFFVRTELSYIFISLFLILILMLWFKKDYGSKGSLKVLTYLLFLGIFFFSFMVGLETKAKGDFLRENLEVVKSSILNKVDVLNYGKKILMPEGDFRRLTAFKPKEEEVLEIIMAKPDSLYLKGFIGSRFQENRWVDLSRDTLFAQKDLFYWLQKEGFHGEAQMALLENTLDPESSSTSMTIRNLSSRRKDVFTPYEMVYEKLPENRLGEISDASLSYLNRGKNKPYGFQVMPNEVKRYTTLGSELDEGLREKNPLVEDYQQKESHYNKFVYDAYLEINSEDETLLKNLLGKYEPQNGVHLPYDKVKEKILRSLYEQVNYNEDAVFASSQGSFLQTFLETSQEGYSVHYATAATLMFRYYGIPARYVEGYLITPEDVEGVLSNARISLDDTHAHAWTEFYQDGVGWIPFETTPPYQEIMEKADALDRLPVDPNLNPDPPPEVEEPQDDPGVRQGLSQLILIQAKEMLGYLLPSLLFLMVIIMMIKASVVMKKRRQFRQDFLHLDEKSKREQCLEIFSHLLSLLTYFQMVKNLQEVYQSQGRIPGLRENSALVEEAFLIAQKAKYSGKEITDNQMQKVREAYIMVLQSVKEKTTLKQRCRHRFVDVVYL